jgi:hypothetical protein
MAAAATTTVATVATHNCKDVACVKAPPETGIRHPPHCGERWPPEIRPVSHLRATEHELGLKPCWQTRVVGGQEHKLTAARGGCAREICYRGTVSTVSTVGTVSTVSTVITVITISAQRNGTARGILDWNGKMQPHPSTNASAGERPWVVEATKCMACLISKSFGQAIYVVKLPSLPLLHWLQLSWLVLAMWLVWLMLMVMLVLFIALCFCRIYPIPLPFGGTAVSIVSTVSTDSTVSTVSTISTISIAAPNFSGGFAHRFAAKSNRLEVGELGWVAPHRRKR